MCVNFYFKYAVVAFAALFSATLFANPVIEHWTTKNGARIYYVHAPQIPMVDMRIVFDAGAARDGKDPGLALMTNGLMDEGAGKLNADEIAESFDSIGADFGNGAYRDMATLSLRTLSEKKIYDKAVATLAKVLLHPTFPKDALERERSRMLTALKEEEQSPDAITGKAFYKAIYQGHPYSHMPEGTPAGIKSLDVKKLKAFYKRYYVGRNAILAIVGDLDRQQAEQLANNLVGKLPAGKPAPKLPEVHALKAAKVIRIEFPSTQTHILVGQPGMKRGDPDYFPLYVGNHMLGGSGLVSRLSDEIREKRGLAYTTYSYFAPMRQDGPYTIGVQTRNKSAEESLKVLRETVANFVKNGPTPEELVASKKNITGGFPLRISSNKNIIGYIAMIGFYQLPLNYLDTFNSKVEAVTIKDIKKAFQKRIHPDKMVTVMVGRLSTKGSADKVKK